MTDAVVKVLPVPKGSIVWLHNIDLDGMQDEAYAALLKGIGHTEHVVLCTNGEGIVDVVGPDELVARVRAALEPDPPVGLCSHHIGIGGVLLTCILPAGHIEVQHEDPTGARWSDSDTGGA